MTSRACGVGICICLMLTLLVLFVFIARSRDAAPKTACRLSSLYGSTTRETIKPTETIELRTVNYNVFGRWLGITGEEGQTARLTSIPKAIKLEPSMGPKVDVITIQEAWCPDKTLLCGSSDARDALIKSFEQEGWAHSTDLLEQYGTSIKASGGGIVFSRWPIAQSQYYVFTACDAMDCWTAKGAVYVRIIKTEDGVTQAFNILGTHLQAWNDPKAIDARKKQLTEIMTRFLPALGIPTDGSEPLIFQGDFNIDDVLFPEQVQEALGVLHGKLPKTKGSQAFTSDPSTNFLVGKDGGSKPCWEAYQKNLARKKGGPCSGEGLPTETAAGNPIKPRYAEALDAPSQKSPPSTASATCTAFVPAAITRCSIISSTVPIPVISNR